MKKTIQVICGSRSLGASKLLWALSLHDMRVYFRDENVSIDTLASELDDFIGYPPKGYSWEFREVSSENNKRVRAWISRTETLINKENENVE